MLELLTAEQMQQADAAALAAGIDGYALMAAAGQAVADAVQRLLPAPGRVVVVAGCGNNGGDGAVAARLLEEAGFDVIVVKVGAGEPTRPDARRAFAEWQGSSLVVDSDTVPEARPDTAAGSDHGGSMPDTRLRPIELAIAAADVIVDALLGAGLNRDLGEPQTTLVNRINEASGCVVSIDLPSGIDGNRFMVRGVAVRARHTVTFFRYKPAHLLYPCRSYCGDLELAQIGIPDAVLEASTPDCFINDPVLWRSRLPAPATDGHKFDRGHLMVRGGPILMAGASRLSAQTALQCGTGLVSLATPDDALTSNAAHLTAVMLSRCQDSRAWRDLISDQRITTVIIGPGNGVGAATRHCAEMALCRHKACVLDADALTSCAGQPEALFERIAACTAAVVLTPHQGEFQRLFPDITAESCGSRLHRARVAAARSGAVIVLKGADTVVATPDGQATINDNAPAWLATAGAGDVLAGVIGSLMAQGLSGFDAACAGVWCHGDAAARLGYPMTAEQLVIATGEVLGELADLSPPAPLMGLPVRHVRASGRSQ